MTTKTKLPGRPMKKAKAGEKATLGIRATGALKERLMSSAEANSRSLSQEAELRLERSFSQQALIPEILDLAYGRQAAGLLLLIARVMSHTATNSVFSKTYSVDAIADWMRDPDAYAEVWEGLATIQKAFEPLEPPDPDRKKTGESIALGILDQVATPNRGGSVDFRAEAAKIHELLGTLADKEKLP